MSLTKQDLVDVKDIVVSSIVEAIDTMISPRFDVLETDAVNLKSDMTEVKRSLRSLDVE